MNNMEYERLKKVLYNLTLKLESGVYDLNKIEINDNLLDKLELTLYKIKYEEKIQENILNISMDKMYKYYKNKFDFQYRKIFSYEKYYIVKFFGYPYKEYTFIFDRNGNFKKSYSYLEANVECIDENNLFVIMKDSKQNYSYATHFYIDGDDIKSNLIMDVGSDIFSLYGQKFDLKVNNLVGWINKLSVMNQSVKYVLYNCNNGKVVVPEFSDIHRYKNVKCFDVDDDCEYLRVGNRYSYNGIFTELEFLIDKDGVLCTDVYDFSRNICYSRDNKGDDQVSVLNSIYNEAWNRLIEEARKTEKSLKLKK